MEQSSDESGSAYMSVRGTEEAYVGAGFRRRRIYEIGDQDFLNRSRNTSEELLSLQDNLKAIKKRYEAEKSQQKEAHDRKIQTIKWENEKIKKDLRIVKSKLESKRLEEKKNAREIQELELEVQRLEKENQDLIEKINALEALHVKELNESEEKYNWEFEKMQRKVEGYEAENVNLKQKIKTFQKHEFQTEKDDGSAKTTQESFAIEKRIGEMTDDITDVKKGQNKLVEGQNKLVEGQDKLVESQDKLFERQDKMADDLNKRIEELMKMMKEKQEIPMAKNQSPVTVQTFYHQAEHKKERKPNTLPPIDDKHWTP